MLRPGLILGCCVVAMASAAQPEASFSQTLSPEEKAWLGLAGLTAAQLAGLDRAVQAYARGETQVAVEQAVQQVEVRSSAEVKAAERKAEEAAAKAAAAERKAAAAAETAVAEYRKKQEPGVIARTLETFKRKQEEGRQERFTGRVVGEFRGWRGGTYFPLEDGQVWVQVGSDSNELPPVLNAEVEIYRSGSGYWRLRYQGGWITVRRVQ